jgi:hypothetical protein
MAREKKKEFEDIAPCPWCGQPAELNELETRNQYVACSNKACAVFGPTRATNEEAAAAWNLVFKKGLTKGTREKLAAAIEEGTKS